MEALIILAIVVVGFLVVRRARAVNRARRDAALIDPLFAGTALGWFWLFGSGALDPGRDTSADASAGYAASHDVGGHDLGGGGGGGDVGGGFGGGSN